MANEHLYEWKRSDDADEYAVSTDRARLDISIIHDFLTHSYWVPGIPRDLVQQSVNHSLCFGLYASGEQVGFARVVTDFSRVAHILDVFVLPSHRGRSLGKWLVQCVVDCPPPCTVCEA